MASMAMLNNQMVTIHKIGRNLDPYPSGSKWICLEMGETPILAIDGETELVNDRLESGSKFWDNPKWN